MSEASNRAAVAPPKDFGGGISPDDWGPRGHADQALESDRKNYGNSFEQVRGDQCRRIPPTEVVTRTGRFCEACHGVHADVDECFAQFDEPADSWGPVPDQAPPPGRYEFRRSSAPEMLRAMVVDAKGYVTTEVFEIPVFWPLMMDWHDWPAWEMRKAPALDSSDRATCPCKPDLAAMLAAGRFDAPAVWVLMLDRVKAEDLRPRLWALRSTDGVLERWDCLDCEWATLGLREDHDLLEIFKASPQVADRLWSHMDPRRRSEAAEDIT